MTLKRDVAQTFGTRLAVVVLSFAWSVAVARLLGPAGTGTLAVLIVLTNTALQLGNLGLHAATVYFVAGNPDKAPAAKTIARAVGFGTGLIAAIGVLLVAWLIPPVLGGISITLLLAVLIGVPFSHMVLFEQNLLLALRRVSEFNLIDVVRRVIILVATIVVIVVVGRTLGPVALVLGLTPVATWLTAEAFLRRVRGGGSIDRALLTDMAKFGFKSYVACLLAFLVVRSDLILVNTFLGAKASGIYAVAVNVTDLLLLLPMSIGMMLFPRISSREADDGSQTAAVMRATTMIMLVLCLGTAVFGSFVIQLMFGPKFAGATLPLLVLLPGAFALSLETVIANDLAGRGFPTIGVIAPAVGTAANIALNLVLIPKFGIVAAAATSTLAYATMLVMLGHYFVRRFDLRWRDCLVVRRSDIDAILAVLPGGAG